VRRKYLRAVGGAAIVAAMAVAAAGCQDSGGGGTEGNAENCGGKIAIFGAFSGDNAGLVIPSLNGAKLAVKQHNAANADCQVTMQEFDTQGDPAVATPFANQISGDASFLGVIGGHFSGESDATMPIFQAGGLAMVAPSATRIDLTQKGNTSFFRVVGNDGTQAGAVATYLKGQNATKVFVIDDGSAYGSGIVAELSKNLSGVTVTADKVQERQSQFDATVSKIKTAAPEFVFYGGYTREAAPLVRQMRAANVTAKFIGPDGLYDPAFAEGASGGAEGAIITCPCIPADKAGGSFTADYTKEYGQAPGSYGGEGFDAAQIYLDAFKDGKTDRKGILDFVKAYDKQGVSKYIKFDDKGDVDPSRVVIWAYEIKGNQITPLQELKLS
jgi:branched-chain amino acid transport system substrate-binding protein